ncbi:MAG: acetyl-CoA carboxylase carboxyltransferase subunit beta [Candidatus Eiseniibacteriota bacterium]|nr:MAG: acetyl-CoA carboxylase carboxyltransferase subunit beta [Candidatus Eisenbacteria bacterium]
MAKTSESLKAKKKRELPNGLWVKCDECQEFIYQKELERTYWICRKCGYHFRISAKGYIDLLSDSGSFQEHFSEIISCDPLKFRDSKKYVDRLKQAREKTGLKESITTGRSRVGGHPVGLGAMDFAFLGGSLASAVGEKITLLIELCIDYGMPLVIVCSSGGARMQEGILSLMQMAKVSSSLAALAQKRLPYVSILTNPTTAGVSASYASLGDIIIAEPGALVGFAGPRVIEQTINQELPPGFQRSEFALEHGMVDMIVTRGELRSTLIRILDFFQKTTRLWERDAASQV